MKNLQGRWNDEWTMGCMGVGRLFFKGPIVNTRCLVGPCRKFAVRVGDQAIYSAFIHGLSITYVIFTILTTVSLIGNMRKTLVMAESKFSKQVKGRLSFPKYQIFRLQIILVSETLIW